MTARTLLKITALLALSLTSCGESVESGKFESESVEWTREWGRGASGAYSTIHFSRRINNSLVPGPSVGGSNLSVEFTSKTATSPACALVSNGTKTAEIEILPLPLKNAKTGGFRVFKTGGLIVE